MRLEDDLKIRGEVVEPHQVFGFLLVATTVALWSFGHSKAEMAWFAGLVASFGFLMMSTRRTAPWVFSFVSLYYAGSAGLFLQAMPTDKGKGEMFGLVYVFPPALMLAAIAMMACGALSIRPRLKVPKGYRSGFEPRQLGGIVILIPTLYYLVFVDWKDLNGITGLWLCFGLGLAASSRWLSIVLNWIALYFAVLTGMWIGADDAGWAKYYIPGFAVASILMVLCSFEARKVFQKQLGATDQA